MTVKTVLRIKRVYLPATDDDGFRVLVDRLWPRGLSRSAAALDLWAKDVAPDDELRKWFNHQPDRWPEFKKRYRAELAAGNEALEGLKAALNGRDTATLLYAAKDEHMNNAVVLKEFLEGLRG